MGFDVATDASFFSEVSSQLIMADETATKPKPVTDAFFIKFRLFILLFILSLRKTNNLYFLIRLL
jgi:hypothetical protein